jgi:hypothetical protein
VIGGRACQLLADSGPPPPGNGLILGELAVAPAIGCVRYFLLQQAGFTPAPQIQKTFGTSSGANYDGEPHQCRPRHHRSHPATIWYAAFVSA